MSRRDIMNRLLIKKQAKASLKGKWGKAIGFCLVASILGTIIPAICYIVAMATSKTQQTDAGLQVTQMSVVGIIFMIIVVLAMIFITPLFPYATAKAFLKANRGQDFSVGEVFDGFKDKPGKTIGVAVLRYIIIWLCYFIPSFIGGIFFGTAAMRFKTVYDTIQTMTSGRTIFVFQHLGPRLAVAAMFFMVAIILGVIATFMYSLTIYVRVDNPDMGVIQILKTARKIMHGRKLDLFVLCISFIGWFFVCYITCGIGFLWLAPYIEANVAAFYDDAKDNII